MDNIYENSQDPKVGNLFKMIHYGILVPEI